MKILIVSDTFYPHVNGASYFCQRLSLMLRRKGHDVRVLCPSETTKNNRTQFEDVPVYGLRSYSLLSYGYRFAPPFFQKEHVRRILQDFQPDVIHCNSHFSPNTVVLPLAKEMKIPVIASNHFVPDNLMPYLHIPKVFYPWLQKPFWSSWHHTYQQFDAIVVPTKIAASIVATSAPVKNVQVISNGIDTKRFHPRGKDPALLEKYAIDSSVPTLLYVGRLDREKHVGTLIEAMTHLLPHTPCRFLIAGKGSDHVHLEQLVAQYKLADSVTFLGFVPDDELPALYALADCFVIASIAELQSIATLEAMATGVPVVGARAMALPELVIDDQTGWTFTPDNAVSCAKAIRSTIANEDARRRYAAASVELALTHDIHRSIEAFERLYQSVQKTA